MTDTLYRVSCTVLSREADREDAVQEALCRAWEKRETLKKPRYFQTWLVRILLNACYDILRQDSRVTPVEDVPAPEGDAARIPEQAMDLRDAVDGLDRTLRLPVVLYYAEGFAVEEIAHMLGITKGAVKTRLCRARAILREKLAEEDERI